MNLTKVDANLASCTECYRPDEDIIVDKHRETPCLLKYMMINCAAYLQNLQMSSNARIKIFTFRVREWPLP